MSTYVRVDTKFTSHPKVLDIGPLGEALWLRGLCYAGDQLTDGFIPASFLKRMGDMKAATVAQRLVAAGLWHEADGGYQIHDFLSWQRSRDEVADISSKRAEAGRRGGKQKSSNLLANSQQNPSKIDDGASSKSYPDTESDTETDTDSEAEIPLVSPPEKPAPEPPRPAQPKPRTEKQSKSDQVYERKMAIFAAYCDGLGIEPETLPWTQRKGPSLSALTPKILDSPECVPGIVEPLTRYTASAFRWRNGKQTPSLTEVLMAFPEWDQAGRPDQTATKPRDPTPIRTDQAATNLDKILAIARRPS
jgi:hypothetical protein